MKRKKEIVLIICLVTSTIILLLCYFIYKNSKYHIYECRNIQKDLISLIGCDEIEVSYHPQKNVVYIKMDYAGNEKSVQFLEKMAGYMDNRVDDVGFIINKLNCKYVIVMDTGYTIPGPRLEVSNYSFYMGNGEYTNKCVFMEISAGYDGEMYDGTKFESVKFLKAQGDNGSGWDVEDLSFAEHFPNLEYLSLSGRKLTNEEYEYLKNTLPEDCLIDKYTIID